jgi:hypothetical protein
VLVVPLSAAPACSLSAGEMDARRELMRGLFASALVDMERDETTVRLCFDRGHEHEVRELARLEAECCPFLDIRVVARDPYAALVLQAPEGAGQTLDPFADAARAALADAPPAEAEPA